ncbi:MAG: hypothetical protein KF890_14250 [Nitrospira sp.]|nr:hypothetical protein [Nitrospira sp.]
MEKESNPRDGSWATWGQGRKKSRTRGQERVGKKKTNELRKKHGRKERETRERTIGKGGNGKGIEPGDREGLEKRN